MPTNNAVDCQATLIAAPGSGQGKTLFTAALARMLTNAGQKVRVFKVGPDYLDPKILEVASGNTVCNLDWWMMGEQICLHAVANAARDVDVILIEGLMGLYDNTPSNAWLAKRLGLPVTLVMDMAKFAQTAAAVVHGMQRYDADVEFCSIVGNRLGSEHHRTLVSEAMPDSVPYAGSIKRDDRMHLPSRHLGLVQAEDIANVSDILDGAAACLEESALDLHIPLYSPPACEPATALAPALKGKTIAIARDNAFSFIYPANLALLQSMAAKPLFFSPLRNEAVPDCDALWLPGGYPEEHAATLAGNTTSLDSIRKYVQSGKPGLAECGGMMVLGQSISVTGGNKHAMADAFQADFVMKNRFQSVGYQSLIHNDREIRGHSFHHSVIATDQTPVMHWHKQNGEKGEAVFQVGGMFASYSHSYFASCPEWVAQLFNPTDG
ncbi:MAG: cobyrinate a,c-diamide synthase [Granulosicoccus sp.]|nr:cobyrinate a,c-diamide synthase [Granulosicoccus sp.]